MDTKYTEEEFRIVEAELDVFVRESKTEFAARQDLVTVACVDLIDFWAAHKNRFTGEQEKKVREITSGIVRRKRVAEGILALAEHLHAL